jgi:uncharacterized paraquat-inducible protein A
MDKHTATELAYKNGYEQGKKDAVRHGRWERSVSMVRSAKCSECRMWITKHSVNEPDFRYCPHCGVKMRGRNNNGICEKS